MSLKARYIIGLPKYVPDNMSEPVFVRDTTTGNIHQLSLSQAYEKVFRMVLQGYHFHVEETDMVTVIQCIDPDAFQEYKSSITPDEFSSILKKYQDKG